MKHVPSLVLALALVTLAACGGDAGSETTAAPAASTSTSAPDPTTSTPAPGTSSSTTTSVEPTTTSTSPLPPAVVTVPPLPTLDDGRPETFVAVTDDYEAVEVDTETGAIVASFGQLASASELAAGVEIAPNVIEAAWRTADGVYVIVSECCEPAGGNISYLESGQSLDRDRSQNLITTDGWSVAPSPRTRDVAVVGYRLLVGVPGATDVVWTDPSGGAFPSGSPAWRRDLKGIYWLAWNPDDPERSLTYFDLAASEVTTTGLPWIGEGRSLDGLAVQASGNLVGFLRAGSEPTDAVVGAVFTPAGELVAEFHVEEGSRLGGYDPSGTYLIYVDGGGTVRWQGAGGSGVLGEGFVFASW